MINNKEAAFSWLKQYSRALREQHGLVTADTYEQWHYQHIALSLLADLL